MDPAGSMASAHHGRAVEKKSAVAAMSDRDFLKKEKC
jgi:hypothetical protein